MNRENKKKVKRKRHRLLSVQEMSAVIGHIRYCILRGGMNGVSMPEINSYLQTRVKGLGPLPYIIVRKMKKGGLLEKRNETYFSRDLDYQREEDFATVNAQDQVNNRLQQQLRVEAQNQQIAAELQTAIAEKHRLEAELAAKRRKIQDLETERMEYVEAPVATGDGEFDRHLVIWEQQFQDWKSKYTKNSNQEWYKNYVKKWNTWRSTEIGKRVRALAERRAAMQQGEENLPFPNVETVSSEEVSDDNITSQSSSEDEGSRSCDCREDTDNDEAMVGNTTTQ